VSWPRFASLAESHQGAEQPSNIPFPEQGSFLVVRTWGAGQMASIGEDANRTSTYPAEVEAGGNAAAGSKSELKALWPFIIITITYLLFTVTDGAVRMLVLLHAYNKGFTAMEVAIMFTLYELMGAVTNLAAGVAGSKWGIRATLISGLLLQIVGLGMLYGWSDDWSKGEAIVYVTIAQAMCGIAKDLTKLGGKTVTKLVTPEEKQVRLFKLVSALTGYKNSLKGVGYFMGAALLDWSYEAAISVNIGFIIVALPFAIFGLTTQLGRVASKNITLAAVFKQSDNINYLSLARLFLFGSRDLWFEVPLPFYLRSPEGLGWPRAAVGALLASYIIIYGQCQSYSPQLVLAPLKQSPPNKWACILWNAVLAVCPIFMGAMALTSMYDEPGDSSTGKVATLMIGVFSFAIIFAINSAVHSYLVVKYAEGNKVAMNVGFYYMANAFGRLTGTIISGALYSYVGSNVNDGLAACFLASLVFVVISTVVTFWLDDDEGGLRCGGSLGCLGAPPLEDRDVNGETGDGADVEAPVGPSSGVRQ
jgi:hypothetical protein